MPKAGQGSGKIIQLAKFEKREALFFAQIIHNGDFSGLGLPRKQADSIIYPESGQRPGGLQIGHLSAVYKYRIKQDVLLGFRGFSGLV